MMCCMPTIRRIDWRWESGQLHQNLDDWLGIGTTKISKILLERLYPFDMQALRAYQPGFLAGWQALNYDISLQDAWDDVKEKMREHAREGGAISCYRSMQPPIISRAKAFKCW